MSVEFLHEPPQISLFNFREEVLCWRKVPGLSKAPQGSTGTPRYLWRCVCWTDG